MSGCIAEETGEPSVIERNEIVDVAADGIGDGVEGGNVPRVAHRHFFRNETRLQISRELQLVAELDLVDELHRQEQRHDEKHHRDLKEDPERRMRHPFRERAEADEEKEKREDE